MRTAIARALPVAAALVVAAGCGPAGGRVGGRVTYDGRPVEHGTVTFHPAGGAGRSAGAEVVAGRYDLAGLEPGPKVVQVVAVRKLAHPRESPAPGTPAPKPESALLLPPGAGGNNRPFDATGGTQTLDLDLTPPAGRPAR